MPPCLHAQRGYLPYDRVLEIYALFFNGSVGELRDNELTKLPRTHEAFLYVHELARQRLEKQYASTAQLSDAFSLFRWSSELHEQLYGVPAHTAWYNLACCASRMAALRRVPWASDSPWSVPFGSNRPGSLECLSAEQCLDASIVWLRAACAAGYADHAHMTKDSDLAEVRERRNAKFQLAVQLAKAMATVSQGA